MLVQLVECQTGIKRHGYSRRFGQRGDLQPGLGPTHIREVVVSKMLEVDDLIWKMVGVEDGIVDGYLELLRTGTAEEAGAMNYTR